MYPAEGTCGIYCKSADDRNIFGTVRESSQSYIQDISTNPEGADVKVCDWLQRQSYRGCAAKYKYSYQLEDAEGCIEVEHEHKNRSEGLKSDLNKSLSGDSHK